MGLGRIYRRTYRCKIPSCLKCAGGKTGHQVDNYTIEYYDGHGKKYRETVRTQDKSVAKGFLAERVQQVGKGLAPSRSERVTYSDLPPLILADYARNERRSTRRLRSALAHLQDYFGRYAVSAISASTVALYIAARREQDSPSNATINYELAALRRMFKLAVKQLRLSHDLCPVIDLLPSPNARQGYFTRAELLRFLPLLPERLRPVVWFAYFTGWRMYKEVLTREWRHVDFEGGWVNVHDGEAKVRGAKSFKMFPELRRILQEQREYTDKMERECGKVIPHVFHRRGKKVRNFKKSWDNALKKAGITPKIRHDLRRTAAVNLTNWGVPIPEILSMVGMSMQTYLRYKISDKATKERAADRIQAAFEAEAPEPQLVLNFPTKIKEFA